MVGIIIVSAIFGALSFLIVGIFLVDEQGGLIPAIILGIIGIVFLLLLIVSSVQYGRDTEFKNVCPVCDETYDREMNYCSIDGHELVLER